MKLGPSRHFHLRSLSGGLLLSVLIHGAAVAAVVWLMAGRAPVALEVVERPASASAGVPWQPAPPRLERPSEPPSERPPIDWVKEIPIEEPLLNEALVTKQPLTPPPLPLADPRQLDLTPPPPAIEPPPEPPAPEPESEAVEQDLETASSEAADDREIEILTEVNPKPVYPVQAVRRGLEGVVVLRVEVLTDGTAGQVIVQESSGFALLDRAALDCVSEWRFRPAERGGRVVVEELDIPVRFYLSDAR